MKLTVSFDMCEYCINFREFEELDLVDDFQKEHFNGFCFSKNKKYGDGMPHAKGDWCPLFNNKCNAENCKKSARWEVGFSKILQNDSSGFLCGDKPVNIDLFCDKHFVELNGCGNAIRFRQIGDNEWLDFLDNDNPIILQEFVRKSYKLYVQVKFRKITEFL